MANQLSPELLAQLFKQQSEDPFLILVTLTHDSFDTIRLVNNTVDIVSNGETFMAFPMRITLPIDDGESNREVAIEFDNVGLDLMTELRSVTDYINVKLETVLASIPDAVQFSFDELKIQSISYNKNKISAKLFLDSFLNTEVTSEKYQPTNFPGLF